MDEKGDEISATFFKDAVDKFRDMIEVGSVYYMSGGRVKVRARLLARVGGGGGGGRLFSGPCTSPPHTHSPNPPDGGQEVLGRQGL